MLLKCRCVNAWQDRTYGPGMRVHNKTKKGDGAVHRCSICLDEKSVAGSVDKKGKK